MRYDRWLGGRTCDMGYVCKCGEGWRRICNEDGGGGLYRLGCGVKWEEGSGRCFGVW